RVRRAARQVAWPAPDRVRPLPRRGPRQGARHRAAQRAAGLVIERLRHVRAEMLGLNRRNHPYLFAYNALDRNRIVTNKQATKTALEAHRIPTPQLRTTCDVQWRVPELCDRLALAADFVLKPARGAGGAGIVVIVERDGERFVKASGARLRRRDLALHACDVIAGAYSPAGRGGGPPPPRRPPAATTLP